MNKKNKNFGSENGSAIVWILVAVALFAALNFAFSGNSRNSTSMLDDAEAEAYANQIIQYGNEVKQAVKRLQLRGCSDTEISFENNIISGYTNPNSPADKSCHVFDIAGGGLNWKEVPSNALDSSFSSSNGFGNFLFPNSVKVEGIGTTCENDDCVELMITTAYLTKKICEQMNETLNISSADLSQHEGIVNLTMESADFFIGSYNYETTGSTSTIGDSGTGAFPTNTPSGCFFRSTYGHQYFQTLLAR